MIDVGAREVKPILSICIPTYNRATLLELALRSLAPQVREMNGVVELVVSDDCSPDRTSEVVEQAQQYGPIRYHRNAQNKGLAGNVVFAADELATGEYCWIIGDDDMVVHGKLPKIVEIIKANIDLDFFFVNFFYKDIDNRNKLIQEHNSVYTPALNECMCMDLLDRRVDAWDQLLDIPSPRAGEYFTATVSNIFRRSKWSENVHRVNLSAYRPDNPFGTFDIAFVHIKILAHAMIGKPAYYIGDPCIMLGIGGQEWHKDFFTLPVLMLVRMQEALDLYRSLGMDAGTVERARRSLLRASGSWILLLLLDTSPRGARKVLARYFLRFWKYPELWWSLSRAVANYGRRYPVRAVYILLNVIRRRYVPPQL